MLRLLIRTVSDTLNAGYRTTKQLCQFTFQNLRSRLDGEPSAQRIDDPDGVMFPEHCAACVRHYGLFIFEKKKI